MFNNLLHYYNSLSYHCPASEEMTKKVLKQIRLKNTQAQIANIGFGKGNESILLSQVYDAPIVAVEQNEYFLDSFQKRIDHENLTDKIKIVEASLDKLPFDNESFDLILSEGGINYFDFDYRINHWKPFLKDGGYLALSELCILNEIELPYELADYLCDNYPFRDIETVEYKLTQIKEAGYKVCGQYKLPDSCWSDFYSDKSECYEEMPKKWRNSRDGRQVEEYIEQSKYIYWMYKECFCYTYFILRKPPVKE